MTMVFLEQKEKKVMMESRESQEREGFPGTMEQRACEEIVAFLDLTIA